MHFELKFYHHYKAYISLMYQNFVMECLRWGGEMENVWKALRDRVNELPTSGFL